MLELDHVVIAVDDLNQAIQDYEALGFTVLRGGIHANRTTHNALIVFSDGTYIELLARTGDQTLHGNIDFSWMLGSKEGLVGFALRTTDIEAEVKRLEHEGFAVGEIFAGSREKDRQVMRWKLALIEDGFSPFLIQDVTQREWRIPDAPAHRNRAVGIPAVEFAVRDMNVSWAKFTRMLGESPEIYSSNYREVGPIVLNEYMAWASNYALDELPDFLKPFAGKVSQEEIDLANPATEPKSFEIMNQVKANMLADLRKQAARERAMDVALGGREEALFAVHLIREEAEDETFTLDRTHGVRFQHFTGAPLDRGMKVLTGLSKVDWSAVHHAYGPATDVPDLLRSLTSDNEAVRNHAHQILIGNIVHQGTIYEASIEAIPFLTRMIDAPEIDNTAPLDLLGYITHGGVATPHLREATRRKLQEVLPTFIKNLSHPDLEVRLEIAENLQLYSAEIDILEPLLKERIELDLVPEVRATCLGSLVRLWSDEVSRTGLLETQQDYIGNIMQKTEYPIALRFRAALLLIKYHPDVWMEEAVKLLYQIMENDTETLESIGHYHWASSIFYSVTEALADYPETAFRWATAQAQHREAQVREQVASSFRNLMEQGIDFTQIMPTLRLLLDDPVSDVRRSALVAIYNSDQAQELIDRLHELAKNDPSLTVRTMARNIIGGIG